MSDSNILLAPLDAADLESKGLLRPGSSPGYRTCRIHKRRLNRWSDEEHSDIPLVIPPNSPLVADAFAEIPEVLISRETLVHVGFSEAKADEFWNQWTNWPSDGPGREIDPDDGGLQMSFFHFLTGGVAGRPDATDDSDAAWYACLNDCGINSKTQAAIMDPRFTYLRLSDSCLYWIRDTIRMRYRGLELIGEASRKREMELQRSASRPGGSNGSGGGGSKSDGTISGAPASSSSSGAPARRSVSAQQQQSMSGISVNIWNSVSAAAARNAPGHTVLYKGLDQGRLDGLFDEQGNLDNIATLVSQAPSDFSRSPMYYFVLDPKVAEYDAGFAKRRAGIHSVVILVIRIPNSAIESLPNSDLRRVYWPSDDWKRLVWSSRGERKIKGQLNEIAQSLLIIGSRCRRPNLTCKRMNSPDEITDDFVLKVGPDGRPDSGPVSIQYAVHMKGEDWLEENARDIQVFTYPQANLDTYLT